MDKRWKNVILIGLVFAALVLVVVKKHQRAGSDIAAAGSLQNSIEPGEANMPLLLELGAHWCNPCKQMMPVLTDLQASYAGKFNVRFINVEEERELAQSYNISVIPVQIFFDADGREVFRHEGFYPRDLIVEKWRELGVEL